MKNQLDPVTQLINEAACYGSGDGARKNIKKSRLLYEKAVHLGSVRAQYELGMSYLFDTPKDILVGVEYIRQAAKCGESEAQKFLGECYSEGMFGVRKNKRYATLWNDKANDSSRK